MIRMIRQTRPFEWVGETLILNVRVQPRASQDRYDGIHEGHIRIRITAPPTDVKANAHLMAFISDLFAVPKSRVTLISGNTGRIKRVRVDRPTKLPRDIPRGCQTG
jgi:uncharacterized protein (TIGR00251 family)